MCFWPLLARNAEVTRVPRALGSSQGDLLSQDRASWGGGPATAQRASGLPCMFLMALVLAHERPPGCRVWRVVYPCTGWGWLSRQLHIRSAQGALALCRDKCTFRLTKHCSRLIHSHILTVWPRVPTSCSCSSHARSQEGTCALHCGEEKG